MSELTSLARPYAKAVFNLASEHGTIERWSSLLASLSQACSTQEVSKAIANASIDNSTKAQWFNQALENKVTDENLRFILLLAKNGRLELLPTITQIFQEHVNEKTQSEEVSVYSAHPLKNEQLNEIKEKIKAKMNKNISLVQHQDSSLIGGVRIQGKGWIIDASIEGQLKTLARNLTA